MSISEETLPKNIATSIKDEKFLNFFFSRIQWAREEDINFLASISSDADHVAEYPFVSLCGKEINFIRPAASPIVFHSLLDNGEYLLHSGNIRQKFQPSALAISSTTGRLYHKLKSPLTAKYRTSLPSRPEKRMEYGLIRSSVAVQLSDRILPGHDERMDESLYFRNDCGFLQLIKLLPASQEPGSWALPRSSQV